MSRPAAEADEGGKERRKEKGIEEQKKRITE